MGRPSPKGSANEPMAHDESNGEKTETAPDAEKHRRRRLGKLARPSGVPSLALVTDGARERYYATYREVFADGTVDRKTKELIAIGVAAVTGCQGCLIGHVRKARAMGFSMEQIKEAVGVAFAVNAATVVDHTDVAAALLGLDVPERASDEAEDAETQA